MRMIFQLVAFCLVIGLFEVHTANSAPLNRITLHTGQKIFVNGINVAWHNYSTDVGDAALDEAWWTQMLDSAQHNGCNAIRWWLFVNCAKSPTFDADGYVDGLGPTTIRNITKVLDLAQQRGIVVCLCLLSHNIAESQQWNVNIANNKKMIQTELGLSRLIDKAIVPLVSSIGYHPAIMCWEVYNEPEGFCKDIAWAGWTKDSIDSPSMLRSVNRIAGAIHRAVPGIPVSNGSWCFKVITDARLRSYDPSFTTNLYTDARLIAAGGDSDGTLDFYMAHFYDVHGEELSPFVHPFPYWQLDKPLVVGEFPCKGVNALGAEKSMRALYDSGYAGGLGWQYLAYDGFGGMADLAPGTRYIRTQHADAVNVTFAPVDVAPATNMRPSGYPKTIKPSATITNQGDIRVSGARPLANIAVYALNGKCMMRGVLDLAGIVRVPGVLTGKALYILKVQDGGNVQKMIVRVGT